MENSREIKRERIHFIDFLRGVAILFMVFNHVIFDLRFMFHYDWARELYSNYGDLGYVASVTFIVLAGVSSRLTRSNSARGARLLVVAFFFTVATLIVVPQFPIYFGILHMLAVCMLVYSVLEKYLEKVPKLAGAAVSLLLFVLLLNLPKGYLGFEGLFTINVTDFLYHGELYMLGFPAKDFIVSDYWPIFPWIFLFLAGTFIGGYAKEDRLPQWTKKNFCPPLAFLGRHSLIIYIVHQPIIYVIIYIADMIFGR